VHAVLCARVPDVKLWWPLHYGAPNLHSLRASVTMRGAAAPTWAAAKQIGFRSVALSTGTRVPEAPKRVAAAHAAAFVGCFRDGNPYWGCAPGYAPGKTCQHALPHLAGSSDAMTVGTCLALCAKAGAGANGNGSQFTLAGLQDGKNCYCGTAIGPGTCGSAVSGHGPGKCMPLVGTLTDPSECGAPCAGDRSVACGGGSYMWTANSVYNVSLSTAHAPSDDATEGPGQPPANNGAGAGAASGHASGAAATEGSGDSEFALVINGIKVFSRGGNLVPFELLEATANQSYIRRTLQSTVDGGMNMLRVWGGGMYQTDAFYEECDRRGVMLYHDMMFCQVGRGEWDHRHRSPLHSPLHSPPPLLPNTPGPTARSKYPHDRLSLTALSNRFLQRLYPHDDAFAANVKAELRYQLRRLIHHASIVLWDSSNENENDPAFFYDTVLTAVAANDDSRPIWPASPSSGFAAGVHTETGLPNGNKLVGRFAGTKATLDTHMPYGFCTKDFVTSKR
jgi:hypothetical protein